MATESEGRRCGTCEHLSKLPRRQLWVCECPVPIFVIRAMHSLPTSSLTFWREMTTGDGTDCPCWAEKEGE